MTQWRKIISILEIKSNLGQKPRVSIQVQPFFLNRYFLRALENSVVSFLWRGISFQTFTPLNYSSLSPQTLLVGGRLKLCNVTRLVRRDEENIDILKGLLCSMTPWTVTAVLCCKISKGKIFISLNNGALFYSCLVLVIILSAHFCSLHMGSGYALNVHPHDSTQYNN